MTHGLLAEAGINVYHEFAHLQSMTQWHWLVLCAICLVILVHAVAVNLLDCVELPAGLRWLLLFLRIFAFAGIVFYFMDLERRSERRLVRDSRSLLLVDTSLSMGIQDDDAQGESSGRRRIDAVVAELAKGSFIEGLREQHDVVVYRFDQGSAPIQIASFPKLQAKLSGEEADRARRRQFNQAVARARTTAVVAGAMGTLAGVGFLVFGVGYFRNAGPWNAWILTCSVLALITATVVLAMAHLRNPEIRLLAILGWSQAEMPAPLVEQPPVDPDQAELLTDIVWEEPLTPRGSATRLGDALRYLVEHERGGPVAGIVVFTDGASNAGADCEEAMVAAVDAGLPLFTVGLGNAQLPANVSVVDIEAPPRVYPGDHFSLTGYLQAYDLSGRTVAVELLSQAAQNASKDGSLEFEEEQRVTLGEDGEMVAVRFDVTPKQIGKRTYQLRVVPPRQDHDPRDNSQSTNVDVIERRNRVLLFAGGPMREFRFLRNQLYRDRDTTLDVFLQTGRPGMSQEADHLLFEFPKLAAELFEYDAMVALDPDWLALDELQVRLIERWVAEKAGGLILVAGSVHTPEWTARTGRDERVETIKGLYPVTFYNRRSATLALGRFSSESAWPLRFTRDGLDAEFLWLEDDVLASEQAWAAFKGVYGYYAVRRPKPGARVYARFSDPGTAVEGDLPVYLASHFYGAGRVFFEASGEMWRLRAVDDAYFERFYTKLIRWVSQGRLLRNSSRGVLMVDKQRCMLGEHVAVRAILTDSQHLPLTADRVNATLVHPDGRRSTLPLLRAENAAREGMYLAQFTAVLEGVYGIELHPPHSGDAELLTKEVRSRIPALETQTPQRNDPLLKDLAEKTGGAYYVGMDAAMGAARAPVANLLLPQDQVTYLPGTPDQEFDRLLMTWLLVLICGVLCLEWLIRRLVKLA